MTDERRHYSRIAFHSPAKLVGPDFSIDVLVLDLSLKGALVSLPERTTLDCGSVVTLHVQLNERELHDQISMETRIAHAKDSHAGLLCTNIDLDSVTHLRRLVELNLGDPSLLERELSALISE